MKQPSKQELNRLKTEAKSSSKWDEVEHFKLTKPTSIRLSPQLIRDLEKIAHLRGEKSYQALLKRWLTERAEYELELIELAKLKKII